MKYGILLAGRKNNLIFYKNSNFTFLRKIRIDNYEERGRVLLTYSLNICLSLSLVLTRCCVVIISIINFQIWAVKNVQAGPLTSEGFFPGKSIGDVPEIAKKYFQRCQKR